MKKYRISKTVAALAVCMILLVACGGRAKNYEEILPNGLKLGMKENEVIEKLGEPSEKNKEYNFCSWRNIQFDKWQGILSIRGEIDNDALQRDDNFTVINISWGISFESVAELEEAHKEIFAHIKKLFGNDFEEKGSNGFEIYTFKDKNGQQLGYTISRNEDGRSGLSFSVKQTVSE